VDRGGDAPNCDEIDLPDRYTLVEHEVHAA